MTTVLLLLACNGTPPADSEGGDGVVSACGDWASVGQPFALGWCASCHSSRLQGEERYGAPEGVDLDTLEGMRRWSDRVIERGLGSAPDMPPAAHAPVAERAAVAAWLACGAPGTEAPMPEGARNPTLLDAVVLTGGVASEADGVLLTQDLEGLPWLEQRFVASGEHGGSLAEAWVGVDGELAEGVTFEPPVAIWEDDAASLESTVVAARTGASGSTSGEERWTVSRTVETQPDPRFMDAAPSRVVAEVEGEPAFVWWFSSTRMLVSQGVRLEDGTWRLVLNTAPVAQRATAPGLPLEAGGSWASRGTVQAEAP